MSNTKKPIDDKEIEYDYLSIDKISSNTECTGLVPSLPADEEDVESYSDLYPIPKQGNAKQLEEEINKENKNKK